MNIKKNKLNIYFNKKFLNNILADKLFYNCDSLEWPSDTKRCNITFADKDLVYTVTYGDVTKYRTCFLWNDWILKIKKIIEEYTNCVFNFCAIMRYPNGNIGIKRHRDKEMSNGTIICGISVGETRHIVFRPQVSSINEENVDLKLTHGSVYIMYPPTNNYGSWTHEIPIDNECKNVRYSLTFRNVTNALTIKDIPIYKKCNAILKSGKRKGEICGICIYKQQEFCGRHLK